MTTADIEISDFDYDSLLGDLDTVSNTNTSPITENDTDSRISDTPQMNSGLHQLNLWPWDVDSPLSDDPSIEHYNINSFINDENPLMLPEVLTDSDSSTLDDILAAFDLPEGHAPDSSIQSQFISQILPNNPYPSPPPSATIIPSPPPVNMCQRPIILPRPSFPQQQQIANCVKVQSFASSTTTGTKCVKIEPIINTTPPTVSPSNITIITTSKPITIAKVPVIKMPLTNTTGNSTNVATPLTIVKTEAETIPTANIKRITTVYPNSTTGHTDNSTYSKGTNGLTTPPSKRRRSESSTNHSQLPVQTSEISTLTLDQLKVQYGNVSEEALKKHLRMIKNRESASLSRKRRKQLMENLEVKVKELNEENERLKGENTKLLTRIHTLEVENELLKTYKLGANITSPRARKPLILMGIVLLVIFNVFTLKSLSPNAMNPSGSLALYNARSAFNGEQTIIRGRTILSAARRSSSDDSYLTTDDNYDNSAGGNPSNPDDPPLIPAYPFLQCVAYINKTHSQRINRELHSWVQDHYRKYETTDNSAPVPLTDSNSISIPSKADSTLITDSIESSSSHHVPRKLAVLNRRSSKSSSSSTRGQLQPYRGSEQNFDDFIHAIERRNDTLYFVSFKRDHLILPAIVTNQTQRPKMSLILPATMTHLNKSIHVPANHVPMIQIDCEVEDTKLVFVKRGHIPSFYRQDLFRYYSSVPQTTV